MHQTLKPRQTGGIAAGDGMARIQISVDTSGINKAQAWQPPASGQARRAMPQQLSHLEPNHGRH